MEALRPVSGRAEDEAVDEGGGDAGWDEEDGRVGRGDVVEVVLVGDE